MARFLELSTMLAPFMDADGTTYIQIVQDEAKEPRHLPVNSPLARKVLKAHLCWLTQKELPTDADARSAADILEGMAYSWPRRPAKLNADDVIALRPLARAVMSVARHGGTKKDLPGLLALLNHIAMREGIRIDCGPWPANEDALGSQLAGLREALTTKGVALIRHENERPRAWSILPMGQEGVRGDGQVSAASSCGTPPLDHTDTSGHAVGDVAVSDEQLERILKGGGA